MTQYHRFMGGIDFSDMLLSLYKIDRKSRKCYMRIVYFLIGLSVTNCRFKSRRLRKENSTEKYLPMKDFIIHLAVSLTKVGKPLKSQLGRPSATDAAKKHQPNEARPPTDVHLDKIDHLPEHTNKGRCKRCSEGRSRWKYKKGNVHLCLNNVQNCFSLYHL